MGCQVPLDLTAMQRNQVDWQWGNQHFLPPVYFLLNQFFHWIHLNRILHPQYKDVQFLKIEVELVASLYEFESFSTQDMNNSKGFVETLSKKRFNTDVVLKFVTNTRQHK